MCSWYDDITDYHSKETDDWYVDEGNLKDPTKSRIIVDQTVKGIMGDFTVAMTTWSISLLRKSCKSHRYQS